jgi:hypothetical protein
MKTHPAERDLEAVDVARAHAVADAFPLWSITQRQQHGSERPDSGDTDLVPEREAFNGGDVTFDAALDPGPADAPDTGLYVRAGGALRLVARTGSVIPGVGTVAGIVNSLGITFPSGGCIINNRGQVPFSALLNGR